MRLSVPLEASPLLGEWVNPQSARPLTEFQRRGADRFRRGSKAGAQALAFVS